MKISLRNSMIAVTLFATCLAVQRAVDEFRFHKGDGPNARKLAEELAALNEAEPESDAAANCQNGDWRCIGYRGKNGLTFPGLHKSTWNTVEASELFWEIQGVANHFESRNHNWLSSRAYQYCIRYNSCLVELKFDNVDTSTR